MKRLSIIFIFSLFLCLGLTVQATTTETTTTENLISDSELIDPGLVPGDTFYFLDRFFENVSLKLSFKEEKKVEKYMRYADERLAELNEMDPEKELEAVDALYDEYGYDILTANDILSTIISDGKVKQANIEKLQIKLEEVTTKEERIQEKIKGKVNQEVKSKVEEVKINNYLTSMCGELTDEDLENFQNLNVNKKDIIAIKSLSTLTDLSISDILALDIYMDKNPNSDLDNLKIDYVKLEEVLGLNKKQLIDNLKDYHETLKQNRRAEQEKEKAEKEKGKSQDEIEKIKEEAAKKQEEAQQKQDEIKDKIKETIDEHQSNGGNQGNQGNPGRGNNN